MNRLGVVLLLSITIGSVVLGVAAAKVNYKLLPHVQIMTQLEQEANGTTPIIEALEITTLTTATLELFPRPHIDSTPQTEFEQGGFMGIVLGFSFIWDKKTSLFGFREEEGNDEFIFFGENVLLAHFVTTLELYGLKGELVADSDNIQLWGGSSSSGLGVEESSRRRYAIQIPYSWEPGTYTLHAYVEDLITTINNSEETSVDILVGPPEEEPHPSPIAIKPEDMIITLEDLPDGWTVVWENPNWSILEGCISSFERRFSELVEDFTKDFDVRVIQYENVDVAKESFDGKLEGALTSEKYGHGNVVIVNVGDEGFLRDRPDRRTSEYESSTDWSTGSVVIFRKENVVVIVSALYNCEAVSSGIYVNNEELMEFAIIQEARISP